MCVSLSININYIFKKFLPVNSHKVLCHWCSVHVLDCWVDLLKPIPPLVDPCLCSTSLQWPIAAVVNDPHFFVFLYNVILLNQDVHQIYFLANLVIIPTSEKLPEGKLITSLTRNSSWFFSIVLF